MVPMAQAVSIVVAGASVAALVSQPALKVNLMAALARWTGYNAPGGLWRITAILLALANLKNLPFVWHVRTQTPNKPTKYIVSSGPRLTRTYRYGFAAPSSTSSISNPHRSPHTRSSNPSLPRPAPRSSKQTTTCTSPTVPISATWTYPAPTSSPL